MALLLRTASDTLRSSVSEANRALSSSLSSSLSPLTLKTQKKLSITVEQLKELEKMAIGAALPLDAARPTGRSRLFTMSAARTYICTNLSL